MGVSSLPTFVNHSSLSVISSRSAYLRSSGGWFEATVIDIMPGGRKFRVSWADGDEVMRAFCDLFLPLFSFG